MMHLPRVKLPPVLLPRMESQCAAHLNQMEQKDHYNAKFSRQTLCLRIKLVAYRCLATLAALYHNLIDLKDWLLLTPSVIRFAGVKFHLANLISIIAFPLIAIATMPFGYLPATSCLRTYKGQMSAVDSITQAIPHYNLTIEAAKTHIQYLESRGEELSDQFLIDAAEQGLHRVIQAYVQLHPLTVNEVVPLKHDTALKFARVIQEVFSNPKYDRSQEMPENIKFTYAKSEYHQIVPLLLNALEPAVRDHLGRNEAMRQIRTYYSPPKDWYARTYNKLDPTQMALLINCGADIVRVNPNNKKAVFSPFEHLMLGVRNITFYPVLWEKGELAGERPIEKVVAVAKVCIEASGCYSKTRFAAVVELKNKLVNSPAPPQWQNHAGHDEYLAAQKILHDGIRNFNPFFRLLRHSQLAPYFDEASGLFSMLDYDKITAEFVKRINEIEPHLPALEATQNAAYRAKFDWLVQFRWDFKTFPKPLVEMILEYALRYTPKDELAVVAATSKGTEA